MCLADFIDPDGEDWIGGFAVGIHGLEPHLERFKAENDDYSDILLKALADRLAESFAEVLHAEVRKRLWGYADEHFSNAELIREKYQGIRPAPGYPACPDHSLKPILFDMLGGSPGGVTLTENFAMLSDLGGVRLLFRPPRQPVFRRRADRPRPARGLCRAARGRRSSRPSAGCGPISTRRSLRLLARPQCIACSRLLLILFAAVLPRAVRRTAALARQNAIEPELVAEGPRVARRRRSSSRS